MNSNMFGRTSQTYNSYSNNSYQNNSYSSNQTQRLGSYRVQQYDPNRISPALSSLCHNWKEYTPISINLREETFHLSPVQQRVEDYYLIRKGMLDDKHKRSLHTCIDKGAFNSLYMNSREADNLRLLPYSNDPPINIDQLRSYNSNTRYGSSYENRSSTNYGSSSPYGTSTYNTRNNTQDLYGNRNQGSNPFSGGTSYNSNQSSNPFGGGTNMSANSSNPFGAGGSTSRGVYGNNSGGGYSGNNPSTSYNTGNNSFNNQNTSNMYGSRNSSNPFGGGNTSNSGNPFGQGNSSSSGNPFNNKSTTTPTYGNNANMGGQGQNPFNNSRSPGSTGGNNGNPLFNNGGGGTGNNMYGSTTGNRGGNPFGNNSGTGGGGQNLFNGGGGNPFNNGGGGSTGGNPLFNGANNGGGGNNLFNKQGGNNMGMNGGQFGNSSMFSPEMYMMQMCSMMQTLISQSMNKTNDQPQKDVKQEKKSKWIRDYNDYDDDYYWSKSYFDQPVQKQKFITIESRENCQRRNRPNLFGPSQTIQRDNAFKSSRSFYMDEEKNEEENQTQISVLYSVSVKWRENLDESTEIVGKLDFLKEPSHSQLEKSVFEEIRRKEPWIRDDGQICLSFPNNRTKKGFDVKGSIIHRKINVLKGYDYTPHQFSGFSVRGLTICNEHGKIEWPQTIDIENVDFSSALEIHKTFSAIESEKLERYVMKITINSLPKLVANKLHHPEEARKELEKSIRKFGQNVELVAFDAKMESFTFKIEPAN